MTLTLTRRTWILAAASLPLATSLKTFGAQRSAVDIALAELEKKTGGRLGVAALDTGSGTRIAYRADERFPFCSTFKLILSGAMLAKSVQDTALLERRIHYTQADVVSYSPVSSTHISDGMTVAELCQAAIQHSDNTAANLLIKLVGSPAAVTAFARSIGDRQFRLDRTETTLNTAIPGDPRDTTTPAAMMRSTQALTMGNALPEAQRAQLQTWLKGNTTGDKRIRAGVPPDWQVGDKTGTGDYGTANDIAVLWPPSRKPIVVAIFHTHNRKDAKTQEGIIAAAAKLVTDAMR